MVLIKIVSSVLVKVIPVHCTQGLKKADVTFNVLPG